VKVITVPGGLGLAELPIPVGVMLRPVPVIHWVIGVVTEATLDASPPYWATMLELPSGRLLVLQVAVFDFGIELIDSDTGRAEFRVVAGDAILREEGFDDLVERRFERLEIIIVRLRSQEARGRRQPQKGEQRESVPGIWPKPAIPGFHTPSVSS